MKHKGFTIIELIIVIVILGVISVVAAPRFIDISRDAKIANLKSIEANMKTTFSLVQNKARAQGLRPIPANSYDQQNRYIIDFGFTRTEISLNSLCPEAESELGNVTNVFDFMNVDESLERRTDNHYGLIGYDIPQWGQSTTEGCYLLYDSFTDNCSITLVDVDC